MKNLLLIALSTVAISANAWEPEVYVGANGASWQYKHDDGGSNLTLNTVEGVAGMRLHKYIAVEARMGLGMNTARNLPTDNPETDVDESAGGTSYSAESPYYGSFYFKPIISNEKASLYGLIGYTNVEIEHTATTSTATETTTNKVLADTTGDLSYGVGVSFVMSEHTELNAEWKKLINSDDFDMRGGSLGFIYKF